MGAMEVLLGMGWAGLATAWWLRRGKGKGGDR